MRASSKRLARVLADPAIRVPLRAEPANVPAGRPYRISDLELASRLSFFLWSSIPDDELLGLAIEDKLHDPAVLEAADAPHARRIPGRKRW